MNKKGVFFTLLVIIIISLFLLSYSFLSGASQRKTVQKRIETMNGFLFSVEEDLNRQLFISGFRIFFLFDKRIVETQEFLTDINASFQEAFYNGTINNYTDPDIELLMNGATFQNITDAINEKAQKINVRVNITNPNVEISQEDSWNIKVLLTANLEMEDLTGLASWNRTQSVVTYIPIIGFEDPTYAVYTGGSFPVTIDQTPYSVVNSSNILNHTTSSYYINSTDAPSFFDRLLGNLSGQSPYGIESLVNTPELPSIKPDVPVVDHIYFQTSPPTNGQQVVGMPAWLLLDASHCVFYNVTCV